MMMLSRIPFSFGRRHGDVTPVACFDAVVPRFGHASPQLAWGSDEAHGVPFGRWTHG